MGDIEITPDGQYAYVSNFNSRVIDIASQSLVKTITFAACVDAAMSPTQNRVVALNNRFREDVLLFDVNGAAGFFEGFSLTGEPEEGDATRTLAISADGHAVVAANNTSRTASILDVDGRAVTGYAETGERSLGVAVSADGTTAVVANGDDDTVDVIDVAAGQTVASLPVSSRPSEVLISPDGQWAYVTTIAGTDALHFIKLDGAASAVVSALPTGQMGSIIYTYNVLSGMALSPDGSVLVVCISFDDQLMIVDTATRTEIARLATGDFPIRAAFAPTGNLCLVTNSFSDNVSAFAIDLSTQTLAATIGTIDFPLDVEFDANGAFAYVGGFGFSAPEIGVLQTSSLTKVAAVPLADRPRALHHSPVTDRLYVALTSGELARIDAAGPSSTVIDLTPLSGSPSDMVFRELTRTAIVAQPGVDDGVDLVEFGDECPGTITPNGSGCPGSGGFVPQISLIGCPADGGLLELTVDQALGGATGLLLFGLNPVSVPIGGGCLLHVSPILPAVISLPLAGVGPGGGAITLQGQIPPGSGTIALELQVFVPDPGSAIGFANTAGVGLAVP